METFKVKARNLRIQRLTEAKNLGIETVYLCKEHDWYVGGSATSKIMHRMAYNGCEALPTDTDYAIKELANPL